MDEEFLKAISAPIKRSKGKHIVMKSTRKKNAINGRKGKIGFNGWPPHETINLINNNYS